MSFGSRSKLFFSQSSRTHIKFPDKQAKCNGVEPKLSVFCRSTPEYINNFIRSGWPLYAAQWSAVSPLISVNPFWAPIPSRYAAVAVRPYMQAVINGVKPLTRKITKVKLINGTGVMAWLVKENLLNLLHLHKHLLEARPRKFCVKIYSEIA